MKEKPAEPPEAPIIEIKSLEGHITTAEEESRCSSDKDAPQSPEESAVKGLSARKREPRVSFFEGRRRKRQERKQKIEQFVATFFQRSEAEKIGQGFDLELHYFWGSRCLIQIYMVVFLALYLREPHILHGISFILLGHLLDRLRVWILFILRSKEIKDAGQHLHWMFNFALGELEKTIDGGRLRTWLVSTSVNFWAVGSGRSMFDSYFRNHVKQLRKGFLKDTRDMLQRQSALHLKWAETSRHLGRSA